MTKRRQKKNITNKNILEENHDFCEAKIDSTDCNEVKSDDVLQFNDHNVLIINIKDNKSYEVEDFMPEAINNNNKEISNNNGEISNNNEEILNTNNKYIHLIKFIKYLKSYKSYANHKILKNKITVFLKYYDYQLIKDVDDYIFQIDINEVEFIKIGRAFPFYIKKINKE